MLIISHRGNVDGPNTIGREGCNCHHWGVEIDLRYDPEGGFYFDHAPRGHWDLTDAREILFQYRGRTLAINIKETGHEAAAVALLSQYPKAFVFDMELCGADPEAYRELPRAVRISDRIDERNADKFDAGIVWLDEFQQWVEESDIRAIKKRGKLIYWVSPELHEPVPSPELEARWQQMVDWGVDGICTDYPQRLEAWLDEKRSPSNPADRFAQLSEVPIG